MEREVHTEELDGIPVLWTELPPPHIATLVFRVGRSDETLATAGVSHMVEHLCLYRAGFDADEVNGFVNGIRTVFSTRGPAPENVSFLQSVSRALTDLPVDRLDAERQVLLTEQAMSDGTVWEYLLTLHFGTVGPGLAWHRELGLHRLTSEDVRAWAADNFTRANAALWMTTRPDGIRLDLPAGKPRPLLDPHPIEGLALPAYDSAREGTVALAFLGERSAALRQGVAIAERLVNRRLRLDAGITYDVTSAYEPLSATAAYAFVAADCLEGHAEQVRGGVLDVLQTLATEGPSRADMARETDTFRRRMQDPESTPWELDHLATDLLLGTRPMTAGDVLEEFEHLEPDEIATAVSAALSRAVLVGPETLPEPPPGYVQHRPPDVAPVQGRSHRGKVFSLPLLRDRITDVRSSPEGVSVLTPGDQTTVRFADCEVVLYGEERKVTLVDSAGRWVELELEALRDADRLVTLLKRSLSRKLFVHTGPGPDWIWS